ncbi:MAG: DUF3659 domain-containing protein [Candidatus Obscuribacterales bacterium]
MNVKTNHMLAALVILCAGTEARADNPLSLGNLVKDVKDFTGKAVKGTAHGAEAVIKGTGNAVKNTAEGAGAVVRSTAHGAGALVQYSEKAVGITPADPAYHAPVAGAAVSSAAGVPLAATSTVAPKAAVSEKAPTASKPLSKFFNLPFGHSQAAPIATSGASSNTGSTTTTNSAVRASNAAAAPTSLIGTSIDIVVDRHGNIIDSSGKLVGRVSVITSDVVGTPSEFAGQKLNVTVNGAGEMVDGASRIIGHILGAEPPLIPKDLPLESNSSFTSNSSSSSSSGAAIPNDLSGAVSVPTTIIQGPAASPASSPASSWTEEDVLKNTAPIMHGIN